MQKNLDFKITVWTNFGYQYKVPRHMYTEMVHVPVLDASRFNKDSGISTWILCIVSMVTDSPLAGL